MFTGNRWLLYRFDALGAVSDLLLLYIRGSDFVHSFPSSLQLSCRSAAPSVLVLLG